MPEDIDNPLAPIVDGDSSQGSIMVIDDNAANLRLLERILGEYRYQVRPFLRGPLALASAAQAPPDLILLDINMPEMTGYEVCERLKADSRLSGIPVIFLSALSDAEDKVKGLRLGAVDYIPKPFDAEEVQARVTTHIQLRRAQQTVHDLLEKTLGGAVRMLWELVQLSSPALAVRSRAIREIVLWIAKRLPIMNPWQHELAATLCLVGSIALPEEVFERAYTGKELSAAEAQMFEAHPERAAKLLSNVPRLEVVAEMIRNQQKPETELPVAAPATQGAHVLRLAMELDRRIYLGVDCRTALAQLRRSRGFDHRMLDTLESYSPAESDFEVQQLPIGALRTGMVLDEDLWSNDGRLLIFKKGTVLTVTWIERLKNFAETRGIQKRVRVAKARRA